MFGRLAHSKALWIALIGAFVIASQSAVPIPAWLASGVSRLTSGGELYPCMSHACGCSDAETCWESCCCFSVAEKVSWAREHGVSVPSWLEGLAAEESDEESCGFCDVGGETVDAGCEGPADSAGDESAWSMASLSCQQITKFLLAGAVLILKPQRDVLFAHPLGAVVAIENDRLPESFGPGLTPPPPRA